MPAIVGYADVHGGGLTGTENDYDPALFDTFNWSAVAYGAAARAAIAATPDFSLQGDIWFNGDNFQEAGTSSSTSSGGIGGHATWHAPSGDLLGVFGSVGQDSGWDDGAFSNIGVEAVHNWGNWRLYGQAGWTHGISGAAADFADGDIYATLAADYFINPNLSLSANIGADMSSDNVSDRENEFSWGGKVEFKPDGSPASFYVAYQGYSYRDTFTGSSDHDDGVANEVLVGLRVPFGASTVQDLQTSVGLSDMNPSFGDFVNR